MLTHAIPLSMGATHPMEIRTTRIDGSTTQKGANWGPASVAPQHFPRSFYGCPVPNGKSQQCVLRWGV